MHISDSSPLGEERTSWKVSDYHSMGALDGNVSHLVCKLACFVMDQQEVAELHLQVWLLSQSLLEPFLWSSNMILASNDVLSATSRLTLRLLFYPILPIYFTFSLSWCNILKKNLSFLSISWMNALVCAVVLFCLYYCNYYMPGLYFFTYFLESSSLLCIELCNQSHSTHLQFKAEDMPPAKAYTGFSSFCTPSTQAFSSSL